MNSQVMKSPYRAVYHRGLLLLLLLVIGCSAPLEADPTAEPLASPLEQCADPLECCAPEDLRCKGDPDTLLVCGCVNIWDCSKNPKKCQQPTPTPGGGGDWECTWSEMSYVCESPDATFGVPPGGGDWSCQHDPERGTWRCTMAPPTPADDPDKVVGSPAGGGVWRCNLDEEFGMLVCEQDEQSPPAPPTPPGESECLVGQRMWCAGSDYCGWGQVECDPQTGDWQTRMVDGKSELDCRNSLAGDRRPDTACACYHYFFNAECCETPDCIVPTGASGQICPASPGLLCDYCNPLSPECVEPGGMCLMMPSKESYCVRGCTDAPCPAGYSCLTVTAPEGVSQQCVPDDKSCYR